MWDESTECYGANEVASALLKWVINISQIQMLLKFRCGPKTATVRIKTSLLLWALFWILHKYEQLKVINFNFLLKEHVHMKADSVHAVIGSKRKQT